MSKYTQILFDADNTLFDFTASSHLAFKDLLAYFNVKQTDTDLYEVYRPINAKVWTQLEAKELDMDGVRTTRWKNFWHEIGLSHDSQLSNDIYLSNLVKHCFLLDDTIDVLDYLSKIDGVTQHIITNGMKEAQRPRITKLGLDKYFDTITVSDEIGFAKPDTRFFDHVFGAISEQSKSKFLVVGDSLFSDVQGGINYDIDTCWFNPAGKENNHSINPTYEITTLIELKAIIG